MAKQQIAREKRERKSRRKGGRSPSRTIKGSRSLPTPKRKSLRVNLISLGCPKNLVDSEMILGQVGGAGLSITSRPEDADVIVINTCSFIDAAKEESINTILEACEIKRTSRAPKRIVVTGCMAQRYSDELRNEIPEIDAIVGLGQYDGIADLLRDLASTSRTAPGEALLQVSDPTQACSAEVGRFRLTPRHYSYIKISEGCDNPCTFCSIPSFRGRFRSKPLEMIEAEARELVTSGARELVLISQDTTSYGLDLYGRFELPRLLERVAAVDGVEWVRVLYVYPACFSEEMIDAVAQIPRVVNYIDIPIQHISDDMLRRMGRRMNEKNTRELLSRMRDRIPGLYLRTTFIVGFPGETREDHQSLVDFVREFRFERLGVFPYSREEGTPAARLKEEVPKKVMEGRIEELMLAQQEVAFAQNHRRVGETCDVLIDSRKEGNWIGRSYGEAPEIDPSIVLSDKGQPGKGQPGPAVDQRAGTGFREIQLLSSSGAPAVMEIGKFVRAKITGTKGYDLIARPLVEEST